MSLRSLRLYGLTLPIPEKADTGSFFTRVLHAGPSVCVFLPMGLLGFVCLSIKQRLAKKKPALPNAIYPRTYFFARMIGFLCQIPSRPVSPSEVLIDFFSFAMAERGELLVIAGDRVAHREFKKNLHRLLPDLNLHAMLESRLPNERTDDTMDLIKKLDPAFVYLGSDVNERFALCERLRKECPKLRSVVLGDEEFERFVRNQDFPREFRRSLVAECFHEVSARPWRLLRAPFYFLLVLDLVRVKLFNRYKLEQVS